jgi:hypothetical protein
LLRKERMVLDARRRLVERTERERERAEAEAEAGKTRTE